VPSAARKNTAARHRVSFVRRRPRFSRPIPDSGGLTPGHPGSSFVDVRLSTHSAPTPSQSRASSPPVRSHRPPSRSRRHVGRRGARRARSLWRCLCDGVARRRRAGRAPVAGPAPWGASSWLLPPPEARPSRGTTSRGTRRCQLAWRQQGGAGGRLARSGGVDYHGVAGGEGIDGVRLFGGRGGGAHCRADFTSRLTSAASRPRTPAVSSGPTPGPCRQRLGRRRTSRRYQLILELILSSDDLGSFGFDGRQASAGLLAGASELTRKLLVVPHRFRRGHGDPLPANRG
jgi:hypothetical protein